MRILVMFDLPVLTVYEQREYRHFRQFLIKNGFVMLQESIYTKLALNSSSAELIRKQVRKVVPKDGLVQMLTITEKQFSAMELLVGKVNGEYINSDKRFIEL